MKQDVTNIYILFSIFLTPFCDHFFYDFIASSIGFTTTFIHVIHLGSQNDNFLMMFEIPMWYTVILWAVYTTRLLLIEFFIMQVEAEKTRDALTKILDNLPDAVLMLESD